MVMSAKCAASIFEKQCRMTSPVNFMKNEKASCSKDEPKINYKVLRNVSIALALLFFRLI